MTLQYHKGDCRHLIGNIKNTTKKTLFCYPCGHLTYVENKTCQCCLKKITKKQDHESDLKKFEKLSKTEYGAIRNLIVEEGLVDNSQVEQIIEQVTKDRFNLGKAKAK